MQTEQPKLFDREWRLQNLYPILNERKQLVKMKFTPMQRAMFEAAKAKKFKGIRQVVPKARKATVTTFWAVFYLDDSLFHRNTLSAMIAHREQDVRKIFKKTKLAYEGCPNKIKLPDGRIWQKPKVSVDNVNELRFEETNSGMYVGLEIRGDTPNNLHIAEAAHIPDQDRITATLGSVPNIETGSNITAESTANGVGDWFHETCIEAEEKLGDFELMFFPWFHNEFNRRTPPSDWYPDQPTAKMADLVKKRLNIVLDREQLFWWERKKLEQKQLMEQEFPTFLETAFLMSGRPAFDPEILALIQPKPHIKLRVVRAGDEFTGIRLHEVRLWAEPKPGRRYVVVIDPSEGTGNDDAAITVWDTLTLEQVAEFNSNSVPLSDLDQIGIDLAIYFNNGLLVIERNNHGHAVIENAKRRSYPNIYGVEITDEKTKRKSKKLGFLTDARSRDVALDSLDEMLLNRQMKVNSAILKSQLLTFIINENGKREAKQGNKDDVLMTAAIGVYVARLPRRVFGAF